MDVKRYLAALMLIAMPCVSAQAIPGDADGNGVVDQDDARTVTRYLVGQLPALPNPADADATQDGEITLHDAFAIAKHVAGESLQVVAYPRFCRMGNFDIPVGAILTVEVRDFFFPTNITAGLVRLTSAGGYDSQWKSLSFSADRRWLYWHWPTVGLTPGNYTVEAAVQRGMGPIETVAKSITLVRPVSQLRKLAAETDLSLPYQDLELRWEHAFFYDSFSEVPETGLGRGWTHPYSYSIQQDPDGSVFLFDPTARSHYYFPAAGGTYIPAAGNDDRLTRDADGTFHLIKSQGIAWTFSTDGRLESIANRDGCQLTITYDKWNRMKTVTDSAGRGIHFHWDDANRITNAVDTTGRSVSYAYDDARHLTGVLDAAGNLTRYAYSADHCLTNITAADGSTQEFAYDAGSRLQSASPSGETNRLTLAYDISAGDLIAEDASGRTLRLRSNEAGRPILMTDGSGNSVQASYDDQMRITALDTGAGNSWVFVPDAQGQPASIVDALGRTTTVTYAASLGSMASFRDPEGHETRFQHNEVSGDLTNTVYADGLPEALHYAVAGGQKTVVRGMRNGQSMTYVYDDRGLLLRREYPDGQTASYAYDDRGLLVAASNSVGVISLAYDALSRLTQVAYPGGRAFQYEYDARSRRRTMTNPDGVVTRYNYDAAGRLVSISNSTDGVVVRYDYDRGGLLRTRTLANGAVTDFQHDDAYRVTGLVHSSPGTTSTWNYVYDGANNCVGRSSPAGGETFGYDRNNALTGYVDPTGNRVAYVYDSVGNRTVVSNGAVALPYVVNAMNQYVSAGSAAFAYDANGNLTNRTDGARTASYGYDGDNRLIWARTSPSNLVTFAYDALGQLCTRTDGSGTVRYLWDDDALAIEEDTAHATLAHYTWGRDLDEAVCMQRGSTTYYYQQDALLNVTALLNRNGQVLSTYRYGPYGTGAGTGSINSFGYAGAWTDPQLGLCFMRHRWYDSDLGRFLQPDPLGFAAGPNLYTYVYNNPVTRRDPYGQTGNGMLDASRSGPTNTKMTTPPTAGSYPHSGTSIDRNAIEHYQEDPTHFKNEYSVGIQMTFAEVGGLVGAGVASSVGGANSGSSGEASLLAVGGGLNLTPVSALCPTFIQPANSAPARPAVSQDDHTLLARLTVPPPDSLLRGDIPICGSVGGTEFTGYRVDVGQGAIPTNWTVLCSAEQAPQTNVAGLAEIDMMQADRDLHGNLTTWNTGLKNWEQLPWHPAEDETDFNGLYRLRLVVLGRNGRSAEDSVLCEVGRAIAQSLPGTVSSPDRRVVLHFPEQALMAPFRVYSILPADTCGVTVPAPPPRATALGQAYRIREPGDRFTKDVKLEFCGMSDELRDRIPGYVHVCAWNAQRDQWDRVPTRWEPTSGSFTAVLRELPRPHALFALFLIPDEPATPPATAAAAPAAAPQGGRLVNCTFEQDLGTFRSTDHWVGAKLERDKAVTPDGSYCLKLVNPACPGTFSCTVCATPFDVRQYPTFSFDYRIGPDVTIDVLVRVHGRWYCLGFTGAPTDYHNRDVNIANLGRIADVVSDNQWHSAGIDLRRLLARLTAETVVDEIKLADWRIGGYRKLEMGRNSAGVTFYLDNVRIEGGGARLAGSAALPVQICGTNAVVNNLGGAFGSYCNPGSHASSWALEPAPANAPKAAGNAVRFDYDVTAPGAYAGFWTALQGQELIGYRSLHFRVKSAAPLDAVRIGMRDKAGVEGKMPIAPYAGAPGNDGWRDVQMPVSVIYVSAFQAPPDVLFVSATAADHSGKGSVLIDDIRFANSLYARVADFDWPFEAEWNLLGGHYTLQENGAAALSAAVIADPAAPASSNRVMRISFGGTIGREYGGDGTYSFAQWNCDLRCFDARPFTHLSLRMKGERGGEHPNLYLADPNGRVACRSQSLPPVTRSWQEFQVPLARFAARGLDLSCLQSLQLVFEWDEQSGTIYADDIRFVTLPAAAGQNQPLGEAGR